MQANNLGMILTVGLPLITILLCRMNLEILATWVPPGGVYLPATSPVTLAWLPGPLAAGWLALLIGRETQQHCVDDLRRWYDVHHGQKTME
jgi:hypothetical protein